MDKKQLIVEKAYPNDSGRGIARLDPQMILDLDIKPGDIIEIEGKKRTSAKAWKLDTMDWSKDIIRIDGFIRENAGVTTGDYVRIRKAEFKNAEKVVLTKPEGAHILFGEDSAERIKRQIINRPVTKGDIITVMSPKTHPFMGSFTGQDIPLIVIEAEPEGIILIREGTEVKLKDVVIMKATHEKEIRASDERSDRKFKEIFKPGNFEKEIRAERNQVISFWHYTTQVERSQAAADYLIAHAGQPLDFDDFHKQFEIIMDNGGPLFPHHTLNWHTYLWLKHLGYDYKLICVETRYGESLAGKKRYISADKEKEIVWRDSMEKGHRSFNREFGYYKGAYYNSNFEFVFSGVGGE